MRQNRSLPAHTKNGMKSPRAAGGEDADLCIQRTKDRYDRGVDDFGRHAQREALISPKSSRGSGRPGCADAARSGLTGLRHSLQ